MNKHFPGQGVADRAPSATIVTGYDQEHLAVYSDLLEAEADGADWDEAALLVLHIDPVREPERARRVWESHLARAKWMSDKGTAVSCKTRAKLPPRRAVSRQCQGIELHSLGKSGK
jgi:hypothetical protein